MDSTQQWYYTLVGANGEVMSTSELYTTRDTPCAERRTRRKHQGFAKVD